MIYKILLTVSIISALLQGAAANYHVRSKNTIEHSVQAHVFDAVVDGAGEGDYKTVQQAIDHAPKNRTKPWLIFIKNGRYEELVRIPSDKPFMSLIGQDKEKVIITFKINCSDPKNTEQVGHEFSNKLMNENSCATVNIDAPDFYAENISFENTWGIEQQSGPQALAMKTNNDHFAFYNCKFRSFQDTWMTSLRNVNDRTYASNCFIEGAVDYFYGAGDAFVEKSTLYNVRSGAVIVAPGHKEGTKWGYVFDHCIVDGNAAAADGRLKLGRPWHGQPVAVYLNTTMKIIPHQEGWTDMGPAAKLFAEYNSVDAKGNPINLSKRRTWYKQSAGEGGQRVDGLTAVLTEKDAQKYTYQNVIMGTDAWDPRSYFVPATKPSNVKTSEGKINWKGDDKAIGYVIYKDDKVLGFSASNSFQLPNASKGKGISIQSVNRYGSLGGISDR
jgi:pectinesterase